MKFLTINKVGNLLPKGKFTQLSSFKNITNFINSNQEILSFANDENYLSPNTAIVSGINILSIKEINIDDKKIDFSEKSFFLNEIEQYNSFFEYKNLKNIDLKTKILKFEGDFLSKFNPKSLAFLLDKKFEANFESSFDNAFIKYIKSAYNEIFFDDFYEGIKKIKGAGFGLTPSGDDFIAGMLYAYDVLKHFSETEIDVNFDKIREIATGKNPISNSLIYYASKGAYYKRFKDFQEAFLYNEKKLDKAFNNLLEIGETSSSDMLTGYLTTMHWLTGVLTN